MELVSPRWYRDFGRIIAGFSWLTFLLSLVSAVVPSFTPTAEKFGLGVITLLASAVTILYVLVLHPYLLQRVGRYGTTLIMTFLFMLNITNLINQTGQFQSWYQIAWVLLVAASGIFGPYTILGFCFLTVLYVMILLTSAHDTFKLDLLNIVSAGSVFLGGFIGYVVWGRLYKGQERTQIAELTGKLSSNRQQSEVLINSLSDGVVLIDNQRRITLINPAAASMAEWKVQDALGIDVEVVLTLTQEDGKPLNDTDNPFGQAITKRARVEQVLQLKGHNNKTITVSVVVAPVLSPQTKQLMGTVAVLRDISTRRAEERRRADFISTASHEMRTPVAAIEGYLALALNPKVSQVDDKARQYLEKARFSTEHLGKLFQDLLTSAKAEDGRLVNHPVVVEMGSFIEQLADSLRFAAEKKGLAVEFAIGNDNADAKQSEGSEHKVIRPLYYTRVDPDRLSEVLTNLFDNAVKYTATGKISLGLTGDKEVLQLYVRDTGTGIPPEDLPHLFQKFYRVDNSSTRTIGGTGLGLFISNKIIELYKGRIWVESELNKGSTFYINLPRLSTQQAEEMKRFEKMPVQASQPAEAPKA